MYLEKAQVLANRLAETEIIGILPEGIFPAYCEKLFPNKHIIDFMNLPYEDIEKFLPFCTWYEEEPIMLIGEENSSDDFKGTIL